MRWLLMLLVCSVGWGTAIADQPSAVGDTPASAADGADAKPAPVPADAPTADAAPASETPASASPAASPANDTSDTGDSDTPSAPPADSPATDATPTSAAPAESAQVVEPAQPEKTWTRPLVPMPADGVANIVVIPVHDIIGKTNKFILRRGLKKAIDSGAEVVLLDMDTPGGRADVMLEMMQMLDRFEGRSIAYINAEAMSAGALISAAAEDIYFAPGGIVGSAAVISGSGEDIPPTLKKKIDSYMDAKLRSMLADNPRRASVVRAMMLDEYVLELDGEVIKDAGSLLSLTAQEAMALYGEPPTPLFGAGIYGSVADLADAEYGRGHYEITTFTTSWSEGVAMFMEKISPLLMGVGFLMLMLEFYTPGFGFLGIGGMSLLALVFLSNYIAGLAGHEPLILFAIGFLLVIVELLVVPGVVIIATSGLMLMLGALVWSLADVWPTDGGGVDVGWSNVVDALGQVMLGVLIAAVLFFLLYKLLPKRLLWDKLVLQGSVGGQPGAGLIAAGEANPNLPAIGAVGKAVTNLRPSGTVEVDGRRFEATLDVGSAERGDRVVVTGYRNFYLLVDKAEG